MNQRDRHTDDLRLLEHCQQALAADPALVSCAILPGDPQDAARRQILATEGVDGRINVQVEASVVILEGEVPSLGHKRLAGVLAHRLPGCRGVANHLDIALPEEDSDEEKERSVRLAIGRNPMLVRASIRVRVRGAVVVLEGTVASPLEASAAERDAAHVLGVGRVENRLLVDPEIRGRA